jgi:hypothetical protein
MPNFLCFLTFEKLSKEEEEKYNNLATKFGMDIEESIWKQRFKLLAKYCVENKILTVKNLANMLNVSSTYIKALLNNK